MVMSNMLCFCMLRLAVRSPLQPMTKNNTFPFIQNHWPLMILLTDFYTLDFFQKFKLRKSVEIKF